MREASIRIFALPRKDFLERLGRRFGPSSAPCTFRATSTRSLGFTGKVEWMAHYTSIEQTLKKVTTKKGYITKQRPNLPINASRDQITLPLSNTIIVIKQHYRYIACNKSSTVISHKKRNNSTEQFCLAHPYASQAVGNDISKHHRNAISGIQSSQTNNTY